jgi:hypothetical protein
MEAARVNCSHVQPQCDYDHHLLQNVCFAIRMNDLALNSNRSNWMARITPAIGMLNVADIPAAAPQASSTLRSDAVL